MRLDMLLGAILAIIIFNINVAAQAEDIDQPPLVGGNPDISLIGEGEVVTYWSERDGEEYFSAHEAIEGNIPLWMMPLDGERAGDREVDELEDLDY